MFLPLSTGGRVTIICIEIKEAPPLYPGKWGGERGRQSSCIEESAVWMEKKPGTQQ